MHIALLSAEYPPQPGGVGDYTRCLGQALAAEHQLSIVTGYAGRVTRVELHGAEPGNRQSSIVNRQLPWGWSCWGDVIAALHATRPAVLHIQYQTGAYGMHPAINFLPWRLRRLRHRPAVVVTFHDLLEPYLFPKAGPLRRWVTLRLARDADAVIVTNEADARQLRHANLATPLATIPIGSNIAVAPPPGYGRAAWRERLGLSPNHVLVAYFGLLSQSKGVDVLLDSLATLDPSFHLLIVGGAATTAQDSAYAAGVERQIERLGLGQRVTITGQVDAATVSAHLLAADLVALPFRDGASFRRGSLLAALAHGCPIVTTGSDGNAPGLVDGEQALLVPAGDLVALAAALWRLAHDAPLAQRLRAGAQALGQQFSWPDIARRHVELYERLVSARH
ncbi:MAG: glycosyltransferase [Chloroflexaceae bacterium]|jgi:glycosyltransferase involved in cell wall biosynthesis|nr:glycosyltransferase [Chloroflexaceae bacterium]